MTEARQTALCSRVRTELEQRGVPERYWACGHYDDDRCCLFLDGGTWRLVHAERGVLDVYRETYDDEEAFHSFIEWASSVYAETVRAVDAMWHWRDRRRKLML